MFLPLPPHSSPLATHGVRRPTAMVAARLPGLALALALVFALVSGCAGNRASDGSGDGPTASAATSPPSGTAGGGRDGLALARQAYNVGAWNDAYREAEAVRRATRNPIARNEAAYLAGLAAYQIGETAEAESLLTPLTRSLDTSLAANASATLGLIALNTDRPAIAVERFRFAQDRLTGRDRAEAAYHAGIAHQRLGQAGQARTQFILARAAAGADAAFLAKVNAELESSGFTLQLGAFSSAENAERFAASLRDSLTARRLGEPRVVAEVQPDGSTLYLVRMGRFSSLESAISAHDSITIRPALVSPITGADGTLFEPTGR